jgi:nucleoside-diphosphate-sugar epimerase
MSGDRGILVTGAAGFLGRHLVRRLAEHTDDGALFAFDNLSRGSRGTLEALPRRVTVVTGDVRREADLAPALARVDVVVHLAGIADPRRCEAAPDLARSVNVGGTAAVLAGAAGKRVVFLSSATVYAAPAEDALQEDAPVAATGVYATTKLEGERLCREAARAGRVAAVVVRNFNSYGVGQAADFLVPTLIRQACTAARIEIASCRPVRDFLFVDDAVEALAALAGMPVPVGASDTFNLGSGAGHAVSDLAFELSRLTGTPVSCRHESTAGSACLVAANAKLRAATGWKPTVPLAEGLARTLDGFRAGAADA